MSTGLFFFTFGVVMIKVVNFYQIYDLIFKNIQNTAVIMKKTCGDLNYKHIEEFEC